MPDINYSDLGLSVNTESISFDFNGKTIEIFKYLPLEYKYDVVMCSLEAADDGRIYDNIKLDAYFHLNLFLAFNKNIEFTQEQLQDKLKLYNELESSGLMSTFLLSVDEKQYTECLNALEKSAETIMKYRGTAASVIQTLVKDLPIKAEQASEVIKKLEENPALMEKVQALSTILKVDQPESKEPESNNVKKPLGNLN